MFAWAILLLGISPPEIKVPIWEYTVELQPQYIYAAECYNVRHEFRPWSYTACKINLKWIKGLNVRPKSIKFLEESIEGKLHGVKCGNDFLDSTPKAQRTKDTDKETGLHHHEKLLCIRGSTDRLKSPTLGEIRWVKGKNVCRSCI